MRRLTEAFDSCCQNADFGKHPWMDIAGRRCFRFGILRISWLLGLFPIVPDWTAAGADVTLLINSESSQPLASRVHLRDSAGKSVQPRALPVWRDHFVCNGSAQLQLAPGEYDYEIERGPEYNAAVGRLTVRNDAPLTVTNSLHRIADLAAEGWWSGDLHVHRAPEQIELLLRAEDLHIAPVITWWNRNSPKQPLPTNPLVRFDENRFYHLMGGEDERDGGALLYFNLREPFDITRGQQFYPHSLAYAREIRKQKGVWIDLEKPFWWDLPAWVAAGVGDSIGLANNHLHRSGMFDGEAWGKPRNTNDFPSPRGNGLWSEHIYYHLLNCGIRIPPSAGSASGVLPNPVGYNRVYVQVDGELTWQKWWDGLRTGRCFVSNGPLLRCRANGQLPGHVFRSDGPVELEVLLTSRDPVEAIEIVHNGKILRTVAVQSSPTTQRLKIGDLRFNQSGWFLVRAVAKVPRTYRFASTGPFYLQIEDHPQFISKSSAQFFLDWTHERMDQIQLKDPTQREEVLHYHREAETFWKQRVAQGTTE